MRAVMIAAGSSVLLAAIALNSADAAPICKNGHFYYGGSEFHHDKIHAEASAVRAWRAIQSHTHGARATANMFPPSRQMQCARATSQDGWRCFLRGGPCKAI
jgi:hypothetical protein